MKNNFRTRLLALLLCMVVLVCVSCNNNPETDTSTTNNTEASSDTNTENGVDLPENGAKKIIEESKKLYSTSEDVESLDVAYYEGTPEILLISTDTLISLVAIIWMLTRAL